jgi:hypothetical protein
MWRERHDMLHNLSGWLSLTTLNPFPFPRSYPPKLSALVSKPDQLNLWHLCRPSGKKNF